MNTYKISKILMPTDFSELTASAFKSAISICKRQNAKLTLLHVIDDVAYVPSSEVMIPTMAISPELIQTYKNNIEDLAIKLSMESGVSVDGKIELGNPANAICRVAAEGKFDLIVMGTHGASGLSEFFIGTNAFTVVKNATCPVLTIPGNWERTEFKKAVFPVRLLDGAIEKYDYAKPIIEKNASNLLVIGLAEKDKPESIVELTNLVDLFRFQLRDDNVEFSSILHHSNNFADKVIEGADGYDADLIIITANLDYDLKAYFVGPFAKQIVNHSKRPVLSIRASIMAEVNDNNITTSMQNVQVKYISLAKV
jgi:nucleotide-binding universal stress UspA family protein